MAAKAKARRGPARRRPCAGRRPERQSLGARLGVPGSADPLRGDIRSRPLPARGSSPALAQESIMALGPIPCPYQRTVATWSADPGMPPALGSAAPTGGPMAGRSLSARRTAQSPPGPSFCRTSRRRNSSRLWPSCDGPRPSAGPLPMRRTGPGRRIRAAAGGVAACRRCIDGIADLVVPGGSPGTSHRPRAHWRWQRGRAQPGRTSSKRPGPVPPTLMNVPAWPRSPRDRPASSPGQVVAITFVIGDKQGYLNDVSIDADRDVMPDDFPISDGET